MEKQWRDNHSTTTARLAARKLTDEHKVVARQQEQEEGQREGDHKDEQRHKELAGGVRFAVGEEELQQYRDGLAAGREQQAEEDRLEQVALIRATLKRHLCRDVCTIRRDRSTIR